jgi:hypothetical protein
MSIARYKAARISPASATALSTLAALLLGFLLSPALGAQTGSSFTGSFLIGFQSVDVNGADNKYREDINLDSGPRLFNLHFDLTPGEELGNFADQLQFDVSDLGNSPFQTISLRMRKNARYEFRYDRRQSDYFYEDTILPPELADIRLSSGGDFHTFDYQRVRDTANLQFFLSPAAKLSFGIEHMTKRGNSTTTIDISRDEFEFDRPVEEDLNRYTAGFEYAWDKVTLVLEEGYHTYNNTGEIFLPGFSLGENPTGASLDFYFLDQPYEQTTHEHTARLVARPNDRWNIVLGTVVQNAEIDVTASERSQGTSFSGGPLATDLTGGGNIDRDILLLDLSTTYRLNPRWAVVGAAWSRELDQKGSFAFGGSLNEGTWDIQTTGAEAGLEFQATPKVILSAGIREESRDVKHAGEEGSDGSPLDLEKETTDHTGLFATVAWRPSSKLRWVTRFENSAFDDPFTLVSPTDRQRLRSRLTWRWTEEWSLTGSYTLMRDENDNSGWQGDSDQLQLHVALNRGPISATLGYGFLQIDREVNQLVDFGGSPLPIPIAYNIDTDFIDGSLRWAIDERWAVGGDARIYSNDGSFGLDRTDLRGWVEALCGAGYVLRAGYRTVDYDETDYNFDDYDANILELGFGYRWGGSKS